jgi:hypothetical protein
MRNGKGRVSVSLAVLLSACGSTPPAPDWQMNAKTSLERASEAYLVGNSRVATVEFARARTDLARTGRADLVARAELTRCAVRVASLEFDDCTGFKSVAADAAPAERAYATYLDGKATAQDDALLPEPHRGLSAPAVSGDALGRIADPMSRLIAAGVAFRGKRADPSVIALAVDTASAQGWSRPLLAWLGVQLGRAEAGGEVGEVARLKRRIELIAPRSP